MHLRIMSRKGGIDNSFFNSFMIRGRQLYILMVHIRSREVGDDKSFF
jgi:hypothetical protein